MRKRSLFLLEIVIAIVLVGFFSIYFLRSSIQIIYQERNSLLDLEFERVFDLERMNIIQQAWSNIDTLNKKPVTCAKLQLVKLGGKEYTRKRIFKTSCAQGNQTYHKLVVDEDGQKHYFLVKKAKA